MKSKNFILLSICILLFLGLVLSIQITTFTNNLLSENLTFTGNGNITRNLSIPKNAQVTSAFMNLSGRDSFDDCFQESTNTSDQTGVDGFCDLDYTGIYINGVENPSLYGTPVSWEFFNADFLKVFDGDYGSAGSPGGVCGSCFSGITIVYKKPSFNMVVWQIKDEGSIRNVTIPQDCIDYSSINLTFQIVVRASGGNPLSEGQHHQEWYCRNSSEFVMVSFNDTLSLGTGQIYEESLYWSRGNISNPYIKINNTQIWNFTGEFNSTFSPNQTEDFSSTLNTALNEGSCDCSECSILENNCIIPFTFHSDTQGVLGYSDIDINYDPAPFVNLISPLNDTFSPADKTFECNATDEIQLFNMTLFIWNSTGDIINNTETKLVNGTSNSTFVDIVFDTTDTYHWNCLVYNNNSRFSWADSNFTLNVDVDNPVVALNFPTDNFFSPNSLIFYNYTPEHSTQTIETCQLFENSTGSFILNQSDSSITEDVVNQFNLTLPDSSYLWNVKCNTTETGNSAFANSNFTFTVDTLFPELSIDSITATVGSQTITTTNTVSDLNLDSCKYTLFDSTGGIDGISNNISFVCGSSFQATATDFGIFNMTIYSIDLATNENSTTQQFTLTASGVTNGGGGGGGQQIAKIPVIGINATSLEDLIKEVAFAQINLFCFKKRTGEALAIGVFEGDCQITLSELAIIGVNIGALGFEVTEEQMLEFFNEFRNKNIFQGFETEETIQEFGLFSSVLGEIESFQIFPPSISKPVFSFTQKDNITIEQVFTTNRVIKSCNILNTNSNGERMFEVNCTSLTDNTFKVDFIITDIDFFNQDFSAELSLVSLDAPEFTEIRPLNINYNLFNFQFEFLGFAVWVSIVVILSLIIISIAVLILNRRFRKKSKR